MQIFRELLAEIETIPAIDIHTHIRATSPAAADLTDITLYHYIQSELRSAGVPREILEIDDGRKRMERVSPYLGRIRNTATYWCLTQILDGLYATECPLHEANTSELWSKVEKTTSNPAWPDTVLEQAKVSKAIVTCGWDRKVPKASQRFVPALRLDSLISDLHLSKTLDRLTEASEMSVYEAGDLRKAVASILKRAKDAGAAAVAAAFEPHIDFEQGNRDSADRILSLVLLGQKTNREDRKALRSYVMELVLEACADLGLTLQLMVGIRHPVSIEYAVSAYEPDMVAGYTAIFGRHPGVTFDVFTSNETFAHELAVVARNYSNVYVSGHWWYLEFPAQIRRMIRERTEMLPMTKSCGFFSDAYCIEWVYGRSALARRETAFALAGLVEEGYLSRGTAIDVARHYLYENPRNIYGID